MSVKAVRKYYEQICEQYREMVENITDLEEECRNGLVEPERIEGLKAQIAPLKQNYERWAYMMFLLNEPQRKEKRYKYRQSNQKFLQKLDSSNSTDAVLNENASVLQSFKGE